MRTALKEFGYFMIAIAILVISLGVVGGLVFLMFLCSGRIPIK